ncbi:hypothetical protein [Methanobrevibacter sp. V14]|uniref:hypothetical protein n=1 Tax=Methanobrevibacter sp. V14 TaxID=3064280 RepID=UPI0027366618|nr:hypothetical protein [Methanobrevibacter sp. V14]
MGIIVIRLTFSKIFKKIKNLYPNKQILLYNARFMKKDGPLKEKLILFLMYLYNKDDKEDHNLLEDMVLIQTEKFILGLSC